MAICQKNLGGVFSAQGAHQEAKQCFLSALETALQIQALPWALEALAGLASLLAKEGQHERAVQCVVHVLHHPAAQGAVRETAKSLRDELRSQLPSHSFDQAREGGRARTLEEFVRVYEWE
jgi:hypothetical protein